MGNTRLEERSMNHPFARRGAPECSNGGDSPVRVIAHPTNGGVAELSRRSSRSGEHQMGGPGVAPRVCEVAMPTSSRRQVVVEDWSFDTFPGVKRSFSTRRVPADAMFTLISGAVRPRAGDLVLAEVSRLGNHRKLETEHGRRAQMHVGDRILVAYADRYAPDQYEAHVPRTLGVTNLVASGGIAAKMISRSRDVRVATEITPVGLVGDEQGRPLNLSQFALPAMPPPLWRPPTYAVVGTSMNSGKTTTIHYLTHALAKAELRPGVAKVTGTGSGGDYWVMLDAGAHRMLDFTDVGMASTYRQPMGAVEAALTQLVGALTHDNCGVNLIEVADGIFQQETARLIESPRFHQLIDGVIFAAGDAMGAYAGVTRLRELGHDVLAVSGRLTRSPLAVREAEQAAGLPVMGIPELSDSEQAASLLELGSEAFHPWDIVSVGTSNPKSEEAEPGARADLPSYVDLTASAPAVPSDSVTAATPGQTTLELRLQSSKPIQV